MTVVSDMSPLHYLILVGCDRILPLLCGVMCGLLHPVCRGR